MKPIRGILLALLVSLACSNRQHVDTELALQVGAPVLIGEADRFTRPVSSESSTEVPKDSWPAGIRRLQPQHVFLVQEGVFVQRWSRFVAEEGIFIAFAGVSVNIQAGQDPYFSPIADRLFWYRIKG